MLYPITKLMLHFLRNKQNIHNNQKSAQNFIKFFHSCSKNLSQKSEKSTGQNLLVIFIQLLYSNGG
jgi:hypothetical protein